MNTSFQIAANILAGRPSPAIIESLDVDFQDALDYATTNGWGLPQGAYRTAENEMYIEAKNIGLWQNSPVMWVHHTDGDSDFACINRKNPGTHQALKVNAPTYTQRGGFTGNGSSARLDYQWVPSTDGGGLYLRDDARIVCYCTGSAAGHGSDIYGVVTGTILTIRLILKNTSNHLNRRINDSTNNSVDIAGDALVEGLYIQGRVGTEKRLRKFENITQTLNTFINLSSTGLATKTLYGLALNNDGTAAQFSSSGRQLQLFYPGANTGGGNVQDIAQWWTDYRAALAA